MAQLLLGNAVAQQINGESLALLNELKEKGLNANLTIVRIGEKESDLSYEKGIIKRSQELGINVQTIVLNEDLKQDDFLKEIDKLNKDDNVHGVLLLRPFPSQINDDLIRNYLDPKKDLDCCGDLALANIFIGQNKYFAPCTAEAVMKLLKFYNIELSGKNVVVLGRSLVIGKPLSMLLLKENATVTIAHSKTKNLKEITKKADILISAIGKAKYINNEFINKQQIIIDVGINYDEINQKICGDVDFEKVESIVEALTPVPKGVGSITNALLVNHCIIAAYKAYNL